MPVYTLFAGDSHCLLDEILVVVCPLPTLIVLELVHTSGNERVKVTSRKRQVGGKQSDEPAVVTIAREASHKVETVERSEWLW